MIRNTACSECSEKMQEGYVLDFTYGGRLRSRWVEGKPKKDLWVGLSIKGKQVFYITAYRCENVAF
jgi:hypothetical protein